MAVAAAKPLPKEMQVYSKLGVKPVINGMGTVTVLGGSLMPPEVLKAMDEAARTFIFIPDLQRKAGAHIAELLGIPGAMVTGGAASAITVATVACLCRGAKVPRWGMEGPEVPQYLVWCHRPQT